MTEAEPVQPVTPWTDSEASIDSNFVQEVTSSGTMLGPPIADINKAKEQGQGSRGRKRKSLTRSMERIFLGVQIIAMILYYLFVQYDPEQSDALTISQMKKNEYEAAVSSTSNDPKFNPSQEEKTTFYELERQRMEKQKLQKRYGMYQDVHVMIFVGFGFLMTFLKKYGYSAVGLNMLLAVVAIQWAILCRGVFHHDEHGMINLEITGLINADFAAGAVLISFGGVLGIASPFQLTVMVILEVFIYALNEYIGAEIFRAIDVGGSMFIHAFGAYFGLALSRVLRSNKDISNTNEGATKTSDTFAMIGTVFLFLFWPSFNGALASGDDQHRAVINTVLSLSASVLITFVWSGLLSDENRVDMVHVQNATLAGGVAVGAVADLMIRPFGALLIGSMAGTLSTLGYIYITPWLQRVIGLHDTCGIHNLHGMPGLMGGFAGVIMAALANEEVYGNSLYQQYPARAPVANSSELSELVNEFSSIEAGEGRTASTQALYQLAALACTVGIALVGGAATGLLLRAPIFDEVPTDLHFDDKYFWEVPEEEEERGGGKANRGFEFELAQSQSPQDGNGKGGI